MSCFEVGSLPGINSVVNHLSESTNLPSIFFLCGVDDFVNYNSKDFIVFQGSFQNSFLQFTSLVFPTSIYTEKVSFYLNLEGRFRKSQKVISCFKYLATDFDIMKSLYFFKSIYSISNYSIMFDFKILSVFFNKLINYSCSFFGYLSIFSKINNSQLLYLFAPFFIGFVYLNVNNIILINSVFSKKVNNYYMTDQFTYNSKIMSICFFKINYSSFSTYFIEKNNNC